MAVVCSSGLVGKAVTLIAVEKSPVMIVTSVEEETKTVEVTWLDNGNSVNAAAFPSKALEKFEAQPKQTTAAKKAAPKKKK